MWIEEITLVNIKCFENQTIKFGTKEHPYRWVNLLGENGGGKSTVLQAVALLLAGPDGAKQLIPRPEGWLRNEKEPGRITIRLHQGSNDPGKFGDQKERKVFQYSLYISGREKIKINNKDYFEPEIIPVTGTQGKAGTWLRENALTAKQKGWFAVGFGAFRRLTRSGQIIVPQLTYPDRYSNFLTQFNEDKPLAAFEQWFTYLDYSEVKGNSLFAKRQKELAIQTINKLLPDGVVFDNVTAEGRIIFNIKGERVPTISLSDGYRSVLALAGDLLWRLLEAFPESDDPLKEEGVVLIDELDIHLHPSWQRNISVWLRRQFPNLQFIIATHSPLIAAGSGEHSISLRFFNSKVEQVNNTAFLTVDRILQSDAFGVIAPYSIEAEEKIFQYHELRRKSKRSRNEEEKLQLLIPFVEQIYGSPPEDSLEKRVEKLLMELKKND